MRIVLTTLPGAIVGGFAGATLLAAALACGVAVANGRGADHESALMLKGSLLLFVLSLLAVAALAAGERVLRNVLATGEATDAEIVSVKRGREVSVVARTSDGRTRNLVVIGTFPFRPGQSIRLRSRAGGAWPVLIEDLYLAPRPDRATSPRVP